MLAKANKLAAASSTDASLNQILPPSQGIEMRLSVQNSEQVANLSKEISRLQNLVFIFLFVAFFVGALFLRIDNCSSVPY